VKEKMQMKKVVILIVVLSVALGGCSGMSSTEQRVLSGGAIGASGGALIGWAAGSPAAGAAIGGGAGLLGGYLYDQYEKSRGH
jgi:osmotically inducible lipoprotein OsmB